jgi:hypothetical protein
VRRTTRFFLAKPVSHGCSSHHVIHPLSPRCSALREKVSLKHTFLASVIWPRRRESRKQGLTKDKVSTYSTIALVLSQNPVVSRRNADPNSGWSQTEAKGDTWGVSTAQDNWGQTDDSGWAQDGGGGWGDSAAGGGGKGNHSWGETQATWDVQSTPQSDLNRTKTLHKTSPLANRGPRASLSAQDHSTIINSLLSPPSAQKPPQHQQNSPRVHQRIPTPKLQQNMSQQQHYGTTPSQWDSTWEGIPEEDEDELEYVDDEEWEYPDNQPQYQQGYSPRPLPYSSSPSKTLSAALRSPGVGKPFGSPATSQDHRLVESQGNALSRAHKALYSQERLAKDRFHWSFSPHKDDRVQSVLQWIQRMSERVGALGVRSR